jgi:hypothetical protein
VNTPSWRPHCADVAAISGRHRHGGHRTLWPRLVSHRSGSTVVRAALIAAARQKAAAAIRAEAEQLAADEADRAEAMQVLRDMETLRAW